jgi:hypothetical protein
MEGGLLTALSRTPMQNQHARMSPRRWTHAFMDEMRMLMEPLADTVIKQLFTEGQVDSVNHLMRTLVENDALPSSRLPTYVREYLAQTQADVPRLDSEKLRQGQEFFGNYARPSRTALVRSFKRRVRFPPSLLFQYVSTDG